MIARPATCRDRPGSKLLRSSAPATERLHAPCDGQERARSARLERDVDGVVLAVALANVVQLAGAREEGVRAQVVEAQPVAVEAHRNHPAAQGQQVCLAVLAVCEGPKLRPSQQAQPFATHAEEMDSTSRCVCRKQAGLES